MVVLEGPNYCLAFAGVGTSVGFNFSDIGDWRGGKGMGMVYVVLCCFVLDVGGLWVNGGYVGGMLGGDSHFREHLVVKFWDEKVFCICTDFEIIANITHRLNV